MAPQSSGESVNCCSFWIRLAALNKRDDPRGKASGRTESTARKPHLRAPLGESFG